jgi:hypothetical protein
MEIGANSIELMLWDEGLVSLSSIYYLRGKGFLR